MSEIQNRLKSGVLVIENWNLDIVCNLMLGIFSIPLLYSRQQRNIECPQPLNLSAPAFFPW